MTEAEFRSIPFDTFCLMCGGARVAHSASDPKHGYVGHIDSRKWCTGFRMPTPPELSPLYCNHANECPAICTCTRPCYCHSHTCRDRPLLDREPAETVHTEPGRLSQVEVEQEPSRWRLLEIDE